MQTGTRQGSGAASGRPGAARLAAVSIGAAAVLAVLTSCSSGSSSASSASSGPAPTPVDGAATMSADAPRLEPTPVGPVASVGLACPPAEPVSCGTYCCRTGDQCDPSGKCRMTDASLTCANSCGAGCCLGNDKCTADGTCSTAGTTGPDNVVDVVPGACDTGCSGAVACGSNCCYCHGLNPNVAGPQCANAGSTTCSETLSCGSDGGCHYQPVPYTVANPQPTAPGQPTELCPQQCGNICCVNLGGTCSGGTTCLRPGVSAACPDTAPKLCGATCCPAGASCGVGAGECGCGGSAPDACGTGCCASGACVNGQCAGACPADHPVACGGSCCLPGASCSNGVCDCPNNEASCAVNGTAGQVCCPGGSACQDNACVACPADHPHYCDGSCCTTAQYCYANANGTRDVCHDGPPASGGSGGGGTPTCDPDNHWEPACNRCCNNTFVCCMAFGQMECSPPAYCD